MDELTATLTTKEWDIVGAYLNQGKYADVAVIIAKLQFQLQNQPKPAETSEKT